MTKLVGNHMVDCTACAFGHFGDASCGDGGSIKEADQQGCSRGRAMGGEQLTPLQEYKQMMLGGGSANDA